MSKIQSNSLKGPNLQSAHSKRKMPQTLNGSITKTFSDSFSMQTIVKMAVAGHRAILVKGPVGVLPQ